MRRYRGLRRSNIVDRIEQALREGGAPILSRANPTTAPFEFTVKTPRGVQRELRERLLVRMLVASAADRAINKTMSLEDACEIVWAHPQVRAELLDLLEVLAARVGHVQQALVRHPDVPLLVHARYTRLEILAAFGIGEHAKVASWQTGVYWAKDASADLFAFTLDKTTGQFSPTTRYRD